MGDFYEGFFEDAIVFNRVLNLTLTYVFFFFVISFETVPSSGMLFELFFEYFTDDWKDRAKVGDNITIIYPEVSKVKKITAFPTFLEGDKIKMPIGAFVTDLMLLLFAAYVVYSIVYNMIQKNAFVTNVPVTEVTSGVMLVLYFVMHFLLITYVIDRLNNGGIICF